MNNKLNTRQFKLYELLKNNYADGKYISKKEICDLLPDYYTFNENSNRHNTDIEYDVRAINNSMYMQRLSFLTSMAIKSVMKPSVMNILIEDLRV